MAPNEVRATAQVLHGHVASLTLVQGQIAAAAAVTASPLGLLPGDLILAPWSVGQASAASADILLAQASAIDLIHKLLHEAEAQDHASSGGDESYRSPWAPRTPDADPMPFDADDFPTPWEVLEGLWNGVEKVVAWTEAGYLAVMAWIPQAVDRVKEWLDRMPSWAKTLTRIGKLVPILGAGLNIVDFIIAIREGDVLGIVRNLGAIIIDFVALGAALTGVGIPVAAVIAAVGVLWDLGWDAGLTIADIMQNPAAAAQLLNQNPWLTVPFVLSPIITLALVEVTP